MVVKANSICINHEHDIASHQASITTAEIPHALPFYLPYIVPLLTVVAQYSSQPWHALIAPVFVWIIIPIVDLSVGASVEPLSKNVPKRLTRLQRHQLEARLSFKAAIYLWCPTQLVVLFWAANRIQQVELAWTNIRLIGLISSVGLIAAEGVNCSHELLHRRSLLERLLGKLLLVSVLYGHFTIEHARGHHFRVATLDDPATLRFGESFYHFLPRTVVGGYFSAWRLELERLRRNGMKWYSARNEMTIYAVSQISWCILFYVVFGFRGLALVIIQSAMAIILLEQVNAMEHYGLLRKKLPNGEYERVGPRHSWDAPQTVSNNLLFKLQVHADHHLSKSIYRACDMESTLLTIQLCLRIV